MRPLLSPLSYRRSICIVFNQEIVVNDIGAGREIRTPSLEVWKTAVLPLNTIPAMIGCGGRIWTSKAELMRLTYTLNPRDIGYTLFILLYSVCDGEFVYTKPSAWSRVSVSASISISVRTFSSNTRSLMLCFSFFRPRISALKPSICSAVRTPVSTVSL